MKKLVSVQYLRAIAALLVVYCHAIDLQEIFGASGQQRFFFLENFGAIGVDIFFVISGFIISYIAQTSRGRGAAVDFLKRRFIRVVPAYYIASFFMIALLAASHHFIFQEQTFLKTLTLLPVFDKNRLFADPVIPIGWTLGFECLFYLLFSVLISLGLTRKDLPLLSVVIVLSVLGILFPFPLIQWEFITSPMILEFGLGVLIAMGYKSGIRVPYMLAFILVLCGVTAFTGLIFLGYGKISEAELLYSGTLAEQRVLLWGLPAAALCAGLIGMEKIRPQSLGKNKWLLFLGDASYSIYLAHPLCFLVLRSVLLRLQTINRLPGDLLIGLFVITALAAGIVFHLYIEKPVIRILNRRLLKSADRVSQQSL